jgi:hypothetical protein
VTCSVPSLHKSSTWGANRLQKFSPLQRFFIFLQYTMRQVECRCRGPRAKVDPRSKPWPAISAPPSADGYVIQKLGVSEDASYQAKIPHLMLVISLLIADGESRPHCAHQAQPHQADPARGPRSHQMSSDITRRNTQFTKSSRFLDSFERIRVDPDVSPLGYTLRAREFIETHFMWRSCGTLQRTLNRRG